MSPLFAGKVEAYLRALVGRRKRRSAAFEAFRFSFLEDKGARRNEPDAKSLLLLEGRERDFAERMLIEALPDRRAIVGLGALRSRRAERRLTAIFELECAAAQAARIARDKEWRATLLISTAQALWRLEPRQRYARALIGTLRCAPNWAERMDAAAALAEMPTLEVEEALAEALDDRDALVRHHAARALLAIHGVETDPRAMNHMVYRVMAEDPERREGGRRDIMAALLGAPIEPDPDASVHYGGGAS